MKYSIVFSTALLLFSCTGNTRKEKASATVAVNEQTTKAVFEHHLKAFMDQDIEAIMADYTEESFLVTGDSVYSGLDAIRKGFVSTFKDIPKDSSTIQNVTKVVKKDIAYLIWKVKTPKADINFATDTFIIRSGKIVSQTFASP